MARRVIQTNIHGRFDLHRLLFHRFQVSLEVTKEKKLHCGGSLISKYLLTSKMLQVIHRRHVLTAAHCMDEDVELKDIPDLLSVVLGLHDLRGVEDLSAHFFFLIPSYSSHNEKAQRVEIAKVLLPPNFSWKTLTKDGINDAALLELKKDVEMSPKVRLTKWHLHVQGTRLRSSIVDVKKHQGLQANWKLLGAAYLPSNCGWGWIRVRLPGLIFPKQSCSCL